MATTNRKIRILCVEDDPQMRTFLMNQLRVRGHQVQAVQDGAQAIDQAAIFQPELILLDLALPSLDGLAFLRRLREWSQSYVIVLSAHDEESVKIKALDLGADDYLTKPFGMEELLAHIRAAMRRADELERLRGGGSGSDSSNPVYHSGGSNGLIVDFAHRQVRSGGREVHLTPIEYALLSELTRNPGKVLTHRELLRRVWGAEYVAENTYLRTFIRHLRRKLEPDPTKPRFLLNEPGVGYFVPQPDAVEA
ncbi:MAG TPA: response regulator [Ktedonobacteraceae bacterium]|nr:response regulator [Ktedonobacteraceae bacterium]